MKKPQLSYTKFGLLFMLAIASVPALASANFKFSVIGNLPTSVPGVAHIEVTNESRNRLTDYRVAGLPSSVMQDTVSILPLPNIIPTCSDPINLGSHKSCILILKFTDLINSSFALCNGVGCTTSGIVFNIDTLVNHVPGISAGFYESLGGDFIPLMAHSAGGDDPWAYVIETALQEPVGLQQGFFNSSLCNGQNCFGLGMYENNTNKAYPLLSRSIDGGATWTYPADIIDISKLPSDYNSAIGIVGFNMILGFDAGAYSGTDVLAVGGYINTNDAISILLAMSTNAGVNWSYLQPAHYPDNYDPTGMGLLLGASCNSTFCVAAGGYTALDTTSRRFDPPEQHHVLLMAKSPLAFTSTSWIYPIEYNQTTPSDGQQPDDIDDSNSNPQGFRSACCTDSFCVGAGLYYTPSSFFNSFPILAESINSAVTWNYLIDSNTNVPSISMSSGRFLGTACYQNIGVAVGDYNDTQIVPLLAVRTTSGSGWNYPTIHNLPPIDAGSLSGTSCSNATCVAVGGYQQGVIGYPMILTSINGAVTWNYISIDLPADFDMMSPGGFLTSVQCSGSDCIATGAYNINPSVQAPLVYESHDAGVTWSLAVTGTSPILPVDFQSGGFFSGSVAGLVMRG
ncbi:MAG: hypothetical protein WC627_03910 [Legionella sp.]|jgi:hypothetical protein